VRLKSAMSLPDVCVMHPKVSLTIETGMPCVNSDLEDEYIPPSEGGRATLFEFCGVVLWMISFVSVAI